MNKHKSDIIKYMRSQPSSAYSKVQENTNKETNKQNSVNEKIDKVKTCISCTYQCSCLLLISGHHIG